MNTNLTPAEQAMACLHETPNGGYAVRRECGEEFDAIPCAYEGCAIGEIDVYTYDGGEGDNLVLSIEWGDEEFFIYS